MERLREERTLQILGPDLELSIQQVVAKEQRGKFPNRSHSQHVLGPGLWLKLRFSRSVTVRL